MLQPLAPVRERIAWMHVPSQPDRECNRLITSPDGLGKRQAACLYRLRKFSWRSRSIMGPHSYEDDIVSLKRVFGTGEPHD